MHFSIYVRLLDLLWERLDDEDRFRRLAHEAVERYIAYMRGKNFCTDTDISVVF